MNQTLRVNKTDFHMKGFAPGLALKQRWNATRKSPIEFAFRSRQPIKWKLLLSIHSQLCVEHYEDLGRWSHLVWVKVCATTQFSQHCSYNFVQGRLGELRSGYLGLKVLQSVLSVLQKENKVLKYFESFGNLALLVQCHVIWISYRLCSWCIHTSKYDQFYQLKFTRKC